MKPLANHTLKRISLTSQKPRTSVILDGETDIFMWSQAQTRRPIITSPSLHCTGCSSQCNRKIKGIRNEWKRQITVVYRLNGEGNGTPLQYSCLENPMDGGAWKAAVHGVAEGWTRLSDLTFTFHFHALEKERATHSSVLAWRIPGTGEAGGLPSMGSHRVRHDWSDLAA